MKDLRAWCDRAVAAALRAGAASAEAFALRDLGVAVEIEKDGLSGAQVGLSSGMGLRVVKDGRVGFAFATRDEDLPDAIQGALKAARLSKRTPKFEFPRPRKTAAVAGLFDRRVAALAGDELLAHGGVMLDAVKEVRPDVVLAGGSVHASASESALVNSEGIDVAHRETGVGAHAYTIQSRDGVSTGFATGESTRMDLPWDALGREAAELAVASGGAKPLESGGRLPVVVRPEAAADLLTTITIPSLYGRPAHRGESYYSGKLGKVVMHESLSIIDDPTLPRGLGSAPFDDEGVPARVRRPVVRGVLKAFLYDSLDASEFGARATGHALRHHALEGRSYKAPPHTSAHQVRWVAPRRSTERLVGALDDALIVHDLMGVHTANPVSGDFSVTASIVFRVRKGAVEGPVAPLSVAGNLHASLKRGIRLGDDEKAMDGAPAMVLPSVLFDGFTVTP